MSRDERQTREELIDPKLHARGWTEALITRERTAGGVDIIDGKPVKRQGRTDYLLCLPAAPGQRPLKVALIEAKDENTLPELAIGQARRDGRLHFVPFVFSTNGHQFVEYAEDTGRITRPRPLEEIPTPEELKKRFEDQSKLKLEGEAARALFERCKGGEAAVRYYQDAAVRAALLKIATGGKRVLLSLATGTGKTIIAAQLLHKLNATGQLRRALFVVDRDELRVQGMAKVHAVFGDDAQIVSTREARLNARVLIASYQTLNVTAEDDEPRFWKEHYPPGFFSHIVIDECHRSAWGRWSIILTDNPHAVHIGLTATPRIVVGGKPESQARHDDEAVTNHNLDYFGEPVYEYPLAQGQEDGYLAACEIIQRVVDLDQQEITRKDIEARTATDAMTGKAVDPAELQERYNAREYETKLMLPDRVRAMCEDLFEFLKETGGPHQKTIIFCARDTHATAVATELNNSTVTGVAPPATRPRKTSRSSAPAIRVFARPLPRPFPTSRLQ